MFAAFGRNVAVQYHNVVQAAFIRIAQQRIQSHRKRRRVIFVAGAANIHTSWFYALH